MKKYIDYKHNELKEFCKQRGLKSTGNKKDLAQNLLRDDENKEKNPDMFSTPYVNKTKEAISSLKANPTDVRNFYLHIKSANLHNYFTYGYFYPLALELDDVYKNENRSKDIMSSFEEHIVLYDYPIKQFNETDVLVELELTGINVNQHENDNLFYVSEPIPISRVKNIFFKNEGLKKDFLASVKTFPDCFIPSSICKSISKSMSVMSINVDIENIKLPRNDTLLHWPEKLKIFDRWLGLFSFMKSASILKAEKENSLESYSPGVFKTLNLINPIKQLLPYKENVFFKLLINNIEASNAKRVIFKLTNNRVIANKAFNLNIAIDILESSIEKVSNKNEETKEIKTLIDLFKQLNNIKVSYKELLQKKVLKKNPPALALLLLSKFPNTSRQNTDKQAVRNVFIKGEFDLPLNEAEYILGILGFYYGYQNMIKKDTNLTFSDEIFNNITERSQSIKFKLESYLDRFIIESIYQYSIRRKPLKNPFSFLNWEHEKNSFEVEMPKNLSQYEYIDESFELLGQQIVKVERKDKADKLFEQIAGQYPDGISQTSYLVTFIKKHLQFDKWIILNLLKKNKNNYPIDELEKIIKLDNQNKQKV